MKHPSVITTKSKNRERTNDLWMTHTECYNYSTAQNISWINNGFYCQVNQQWQNSQQTEAENSVLFAVMLKNFSSYNKSNLLGEFKESYAHTQNVSSVTHDIIGWNQNPKFCWSHSQRLSFHCYICVILKSRADSNMVYHRFIYFDSWFQRS